MNKIESIYRYPIKGLSGEPLDTVTLSPGEVIPGDREYAFARAGVGFDPDNPEYLRKTNFLALVRDEQLAEFKTQLDFKSRILSIFRDTKLVIKADLNNSMDCGAAAEVFREHLEMAPENQPRIVRATGGTVDHSFSDVPDKAISLINLASVRDFGQKIGAEIDPERFRSNIIFNGDAAWQEFEWIGQNLQIGEVVLQAYQRTERCAATMVNPTTAERDLNIPKELVAHYDHMDMGIYAKVLKGGEIKPGEEIEII